MNPERINYADDGGKLWNPHTLMKNAVWSYEK